MKSAHGPILGSTILPCRHVLFYADTADKLATGLDA